MCESCCLAGRKQIVHTIRSLFAASAVLSVPSLASPLGQVDRTVLSLTNADARSIG
jgi:hypothetical protein